MTSFFERGYLSIFFLIQNLNNWASFLAPTNHRQIRTLAMDSYTHHLAIIRTSNGILDVYWNIDKRTIRYVCGAMGFERANETIRTSLATLFGCSPSWLEIRSLVIIEGKYRSLFDNHHKMSQELLECEWSDYGMDRMSFQISLGIGSEANEREAQFFQLQDGIMDMEEDPQVFG